MKGGDIFERHILAQSAVLVRGEGVWLSGAHVNHAWSLPLMS